MSYYEDAGSQEVRVVSVVFNSAQHCAILLSHTDKVKSKVANNQLSADTVRRRRPCCGRTSSE